MTELEDWRPNGHLRTKALFVERGSMFRRAKMQVYDGNCLQYQWERVVEKLVNDVMIRIIETEWRKIPHEEAP